MTEFRKTGDEVEKKEKKRKEKKEALSIKIQISIIDSSILESPKFFQPSFQRIFAKWRNQAKHINHIVEIFLPTSTRELYAYGNFRHNFMSREYLCLATTDGWQFRCINIWHYHLEGADMTDWLNSYGWKSWNGANSTFAQTKLHLANLLATDKLNSKVHIFFTLLSAFARLLSTCCIEMSFYWFQTKCLQWNTVIQTHLPRTWLKPIATLPSQHSHFEHSQLFVEIFVENSLSPIEYVANHSESNRYLLEWPQTWQTFHQPICLHIILNHEFYLIRLDHKPLSITIVDFQLSACWRSFCFQYVNLTVSQS